MVKKKKVRDKFSDSPANKTKAAISVRDLRRDVLSAFYRMGGVGRLVKWAEEKPGNYEAFIMKVMLPLLPKIVDNELYETSHRARTETASVARFDRAEFNVYLKSVGRAETPILTEPVTEKKVECRVDKEINEHVPGDSPGGVLRSGEE